MTTSFIGLKELRNNLTKLADSARRRKRRYIVMRKNRPLFELRPLSEEDAVRAAFAHDIKEAEADVRAGRVHTPEEIDRILGL